MKNTFLFGAVYSAKLENPFKSLAVPRIEYSRLVYIGVDNSEEDITLHEFANGQEKIFFDDDFINVDHVPNSVKIELK